VTAALLSIGERPVKTELGKTDVFSKEKRSNVMSLIRGSGNKDTELRLIAIFRAHSITGWRRNSAIAGKPDFVFPRERLAVFVDGCFWHGCPTHATWPKNNADFWRAKILGNQKRDRAVTRLLKREGWRVIRIWEHALTRKHAARTVTRLKRVLETGRIGGGGNREAREVARRFRGEQ
jgi:DNA mismatch endonuclease (patch repair protein)